MFIFLLLFSSLDCIVAVVDDVPILKSEVEDRLDLLFFQLPFLQIEDTTALKKEIVEKLIDQHILRKIAERESLTINEERIKEEARRTISMIEKQMDTIPELKELAIKKGITLAKIERLLEDEIYAKYAGELILSKKGYSNPYVSPGEIKKFYEKYKDSIAVVPGRVKLAHILLLLKPSPKKEQRAFRKIMEIYDILLRGGDFPVVAESFSEDEKTKYRGGLIGWLSLKELSPEIDTAVSSLNPGEISKPVRARDGYHIFKCEKRRKNQILLRHILVKVKITKEDSLWLEKKAEEIYKVLKQHPEKFEKMAKKYSEDMETREKGGYLGEFLLEGLVPPFDEVVKNLKEGEISKPVFSPFGVHIIKIIEKKEKRIKSFEEVKTEIRNFLLQKKKEEKLQEIIEEAKEDIFVEIKENG